MTRPTSSLLLIALGLVALCIFGCVHQASAIRLSGRYTSKDDKFGIFIFRTDGSFGYKFATKFDFFSEDNLPPNLGRYCVHGNQIELSGLSTNQPKFRIELLDEGKAFFVIRAEKLNGFSDKALYRKE